MLPQKGASPGTGQRDSADLEKCLKFPITILGASPEAFDQTHAKKYVRNFFPSLQKPACCEVLQRESNLLGYAPSGIDLPFRLQTGSWVQAKSTQTSRYRTDCE